MTHLPYNHNSKCDLKDKAYCPPPNNPFCFCRRLGHWSARDALVKAYQTHGDWITFIPDVKDVYDPATMKHKGQPIQTVHHYKLKEGQ